MAPPTETGQFSNEEVRNIGRLSRSTGESPMYVAEMIAAKREFADAPQGEFDPIGLQEATKHAALMTFVSSRLQSARDAGTIDELNIFMSAQRKLWNSFPILIPFELNRLDALSKLRKKLGVAQQVDLPFMGGMVKGLSEDQFKRLVPEPDRQQLLREPRVLQFKGEEFHVTSQPLVEVLKSELALGAFTLDRLSPKELTQFSAVQQQNLREAAARSRLGKPA